MNVNLIGPGRNPPHDVNALIEIPVGGAPAKYEIDKPTGALFLDRFLQTAMFYPGNYGFIPGTLSEDGDPCDVLLIAPIAVVPGAVVRCRPVGALVMTDQAGPDEKIVAVPVDDLSPAYAEVRSYRDLPKGLIDQIAHFFRHYKDLEDGKWTEIEGWVDAEAAQRLVLDAIDRVRTDGTAAAEREQPQAMTPEPERRNGHA